MKRRFFPSTVPNAFRSASRPARGLRRQLRVEALEDRRVLSTVPPGGGDGGDDEQYVFYSFEDFVETYIPDDLPAIDLDAEQVHLVASIAEPHKIKIYTPHNVNAADSTNADELQVGGSSGLDLTGAGVTVGVWDGGAVRETHQEFGGRVTLMENVAYSDHATHVAGTIGASGINVGARGMADAVEIRSWDFQNDASELAANANGVQASNHSYGFPSGWAFNVIPFPQSPSGVVDLWLGDLFSSLTEDRNFGKYDATASQLDATLHSNPHLLSVWSAGNSHGDGFQDFSTVGLYAALITGDIGIAGYAGPGLYIVPTNLVPAPPPNGEGADGFDTISRTQTAKNGLTIGAAEDATDDPKDSSTLQITSFSSVGPTDDGRIKPDLVANGDDLLSPVATGDADYDTYPGTSMSAPNTTGSAVLVMEHYHNLFGQYPNAATIKNALIHTATDAGRPGPDYVYGWGYVDALAAATFFSNAANRIANDQIFDGTYSGQEKAIPLLSDGTGRLTASITWTDPAGPADNTNTTDDRTSRLVHDLDIWVTGPNGSIHYPWSLDPDNPARNAIRTAANHRDNVEQVMIDTPVEGLYTLHIGHTGTVPSQNYSLLVSGAEAVDVQGVKFQDKNQNGVQDADEGGLGGWTIYVDLNNNARLDPAEPSVVTNNFGQYVFSLAPGDYVIREVMRDNWTQTFPAGDGAHRVTVQGGGETLTGIDFGNYPEPGEINGLVWSDLNQNAVRDNGETGLANITLFLDEDGDGAISAGEPTTVSASDGSYTFTDVAVGTYTVLQELPPGMTQTFPAVGGHTFFVDAGSVVSGRNFGNYYEPATVAGFVWHDANSSGARETGERGMAGIRVYLDINRNGRLNLSEPSKLTSATGRYEFIVPPGDYQIRVAPMLGFTQSYPLAGAPHEISAEPNGLLIGNDFGLRGFTADFGDAPQPYPTHFTNGGAAHEFGSGLALGSVVSAELNGQPSVGATADDDDGVTFLSMIEAGLVAAVQVTANAPGTLSAWIDFDRDGKWDPTTEQIIANQQVGPGSAQFTFEVPETAVAGISYARFRLSTDQGLLPTGVASDGEVEDYKVTLINNIPDPNDENDSDRTGDGDPQVVIPESHTNPNNRFDVDNDGNVTLSDVMRIVTDLRSNGVRPLPTPTIPLSSYVDVNGDSQVTINDALQVIRELILARAAGEAENGASSFAGKTAASDVDSPAQSSALVAEAEADNRDLALLAETAAAPKVQLASFADDDDESADAIDLIADDVAEAWELEA